MTPIIFGGGHETAYGHYLGVRKYIGEDASLGIINIDAHFDLRPYDEQPSSGTMFKQILEHDKIVAILSSEFSDTEIHRNYSIQPIDSVLNIYTKIICILEYGKINNGSRTIYQPA